MNTPELYEIRVAAHLNQMWTAQFDEMSMRHELEGETVLSGILNQAALHGVSRFTHEKQKGCENPDRRISLNLRLNTGTWRTTDPLSWAI